jgi:mevalonate kinase
VKRGVGVARGKAILFGEHAVVHGHPALAAGLERGVVVEVFPDPSGPVMEVDPWGLEARPGGERVVDRALASFLARRGLEQAELRLRATSDVPLGAGLGSSAALFAAAAQGLASYRGEFLQSEELELWVGAAEQVFHGSPSGIDVAATTRGGVGWFVRGQGWKPVALPEKLALVVGREAGRRDTGSVVARVGRRLETEPDVVHAILARVGDLARAARPALVAGDWPRVGALMRRNHELLRELGVSTPGLDDLCALARAEGALGAKLTGAGGGGSVIALAPGNEARIAAVWRASGREAFVTEISAPL